MDESRWNSILTEFEEVMDHESVRQFCARHHISSKELKCRLNDYRKNKLENEIVCVELNPVFGQSESRFMTLECNDVKVHVYQNFDSNLLLDILKVVKLS